MILDGKHQEVMRQIMTSSTRLWVLPHEAMGAMAEPARLILVSRTNPGVWPLGRKSSPNEKFAVAVFEVSEQTIVV